jgi:hypothetical protein
MNRLLGVVLCGSLCAWAFAALAQGDSVSQTVGHGQIDWSKKTITATGSGAPNLKAPNVAVARLGAERAAKMDALRNIIEAVKGVRVSGGESAGDMMNTAPEIKAQVEGIVRKFKVLDTKYYSDGGVDVVVQVPLDGVLTEALVKNAGGKAAKATAKDASGTTGVIINAKGLSVTPALAPRIVDDKGKEIYGAKVVSADAVQKHGVAGYAGTLDLAMKDVRVADKPLVIRAQKLTEAGGSDLVVSADDGAKISKLAGLLASGKVIIVTD